MISKRFVVLIWILAILGFLSFLPIAPQIPLAFAAPGDIKYSQQKLKSSMTVYVNCPGVKASAIRRTKGGYIAPAEFKKHGLLCKAKLEWVGVIEGSPAVSINIKGKNLNSPLPITEIIEPQSVIFIDWDNDWDRPVRNNLKKFYKKYLW
jgi:hypothetical protein